MQIAQAMIVNRTNSKVRSFTDLDPEIEPQLPSCRRLSIIDRLAQALDSASSAQKLGITLSTGALASGSRTTSDWKYVNGFVDCTALLLDASNGLQDRLGNIRGCLRSIQIALHRLEGEHEPSPAVLLRTVASLESGDFGDGLSGGCLEKCVSKLRTVGKKLNEQAFEDNKTDDGLSPELYKALSGSWEMAVLAIGIICSATSFRFQTPNKLQKRITNETGSMEELAGIALRARTLLKLVSTWGMGKDNGVMRRMASKALAGELRSMMEHLEKTLSPLEAKIGELYRDIVALRMSLLGFLSITREEGAALELAKPARGERRRGIEPVDVAVSLTWVRLKPKLNRRSSLSKIGPHCLGFNRSTSFKPSSYKII
ncbi:hypothetical protein HPP92_005327 [Vanilla planifolia]|uniref:Uncharacterized protein n=1 Tax=Vanilla planifolia TaxID=51239 RepID=A0A835RHI6_VANPL|nr:hypothetical protein HPP92_005644 [Vanilla planifolia]KAG0494333.1 hypothetical protein HPP92_005327 [Vanilla planifolia]